jgi:hypothetical protein
LELFRALKIIAYAADIYVCVLWWVLEIHFHFL